MFCTISGKVPTVPVVNRNTGRLYDRRLIEKALQETGGKCPETDDPITSEDLITLRSGEATSEASIVNPADLTSIPAVLSHLQNQWDACDLERLHLRRSLRDTRKELASALYRLDAAIRAIARLRADSTVHTQATNGVDTTTPDVPPNSANNTQINPQPDSNLVAEKKNPEIEKKAVKTPGKMGVHDGNVKETQPSREENVEAKDAPMHDQTTNSAAAQSVETREDVVWPTDLIAAAEKLELQLFTKRKAREVPSDWTRAEDVGSFNMLSSTIRKDRGAVVGLGMCEAGEFAVAAWRNGRVGKIRIDSMKDSGGVDDAHKGGVTAVWSDDGLQTRILSGGEDGCVRVWNSVDWNGNGRYGGHDGRGAVVGLQRHAMGTIVLVGREGGWDWRELESGTVVGRGDGGVGKGYTCGAIHPDGRLFAMGRVDGTVEMVDGTRMKVLERLQEGAGEVQVVAMSEKGYQMATCDGDGVKLWDLRKHKVVGQVELHGCGRGVALDGVGEYGVGLNGNSAVMFLAKKKTKVVGRVPIAEFDSDGSGQGMTKLAAAWGPSGAYVLAGAVDGSVYRVGRE